MHDLLMKTILLVPRNKWGGAGESFDSNFLVVTLVSGELGHV